VHVEVLPRPRLATRSATAVELGGRLLAVALLWRAGPKIFYADLADYARTAAPLGWHHLPYRGLTWAFPPLTLPFLALAKALGGRPDAYALAFGAATVGLEYGSLCVLRAQWPQHGRSLTRWWSVVVLPVAAVAWFRLDFLAVLFAALALVAVEQRRRAGHLAVLGAFAKLWPVVWLAVLAVRRTWRDAATGAVGLLAGVAAWWAWSPKGLSSFLQQRSGSGLEVESVAGSVVQVLHASKPAFTAGAWVVGAGGWGWVNTASSAVIVGVGVVVLWRAWRAEGDPVAVAGALVATILVTSRLLSAQYVVWLGPCVVVLAAVRGRRRLGVAAALTSGLTLLYLTQWEAVRLAHGAGPWLLLARNATLIWVWLELVVLAGHRTDVLQTVEVTR